MKGQDKMSLQTINLNQAIYEIKDALNERDNPFFFIVGAGISYDSVPLARDIIELCKDKIKESKVTFNVDENLKGAEEYSFWLEKAYPQPISRQRSFRELIENKNITPANFRLAHLLAYSNLGNIVVTPNFDDFLTRALNHFNVKHIICDHPESAFKVNSEIKDIQIVHVHGTYLSYDCCNLTPEIIARNKGSELTTNTMASLLERVAESISPIVVGYSGWENDVIMTSLRKRLQSRRLPYKLYWFCYSGDQLNTLPKWLVDHNDVVFVVPENNNTVTSHDDSEDIHEHFNIDPHDKLVIQNETTLSAQVVFDRLVNALDLPEPEITEDPITFFIKFLGGNRVDEKSKDVFFLDHVIERLKNLQKLEKEDEGKDNQNLSLFKNIRGFARRSQYDTAARLLQELNYENFSENTLIELMQVIMSIIFSIDQDIDKDYQLTLMAYDCLDDVIQKLKDKNPEKIMGLNEVLILAYDLKAELYKDMNDEQNFLLTIDKIIELSSDEMDSKLQVYLVRATFNKAISFITTETKQAITMLEGLIQNLQKVEDKVVPYIRASATRLINIHMELEDFTNAHKYCDYLIEHSDLLGEKAEPLGLLFKMRVFIHEGKKKEAELILQNLESKFSETTNGDIQEILIAAITTYSQGDTDSHNSLASPNKIIGLFRNSKHKKVQKLVGSSYFEKAFNFYSRGDQLTAADNFVKALELGITLAGVNIFYLLRKNEIQQNMIHYTMEELITPKLNENEPFALINQALYLIENNDENWIEADKLISKIATISNKRDELEDVKSWWVSLSVSGDTEGDLVLAWLIRHKLIKDPENLSIRDRLEKVTQLNIPDFMFVYADEISSL